MNCRKSPTFLLICFVLCFCFSCNGEIGKHRSANPDLYGSAFQGDSLGNVPLLPGSYGGPAVSFRFPASKSGRVTSLTYYNQYRLRGGYGKGDGGVILIELRTDDGTPRHWPSSNVIASHILVRPMAAGHFPLIYFEKPPHIEKGKLYHIVFSNIHVSPRRNYVSINCIHNYPRGPAPASRALAGSRDLAVLVRSDNRETWRRRHQSTPVFNIFYSDNEAVGQGYVSAISGWPVTVNATYKVRETFVVRGTEKVITEVSVRVSRRFGDLNVRLEEQDGTLIEEGVIPGFSGLPVKRSVPRMTWYSLKFRDAHVLESEKGYNLVVYSQNGSYITFGLLKGNRYDFGPETHFSDGWAQYSMDGGSNWIDYVYVLPTRDVDLQFYFALETGTDRSHALQKLSMWKPN